MARGWESKSIESQQYEEFQPEVTARSGEEIERTRRREGLELSRTRIRRELENATAPVHRQALENALQYLDDELLKFR